jgi:hypothetical protein
VQSGPVKYLDVVAVQVETLRDQGTQFAGATGALKWLPQFDNPTPLAGIRLAGNLVGGGYEVCVIPGGHDQRLVAASICGREALHKSLKLLQIALAT